MRGTWIRARILPRQRNGVMGRGNGQVSKAVRPFSRGCNRLQAPSQSYSSSHPDPAHVPTLVCDATDRSPKKLITQGTSRDSSKEETTDAATWSLLVVPSFRLASSPTLLFLLHFLAGIFPLSGNPDPTVKHVSYEVPDLRVILDNHKQGMVGWRLLLFMPGGRAPRLHVLINVWTT